MKILHLADLHMNSNWLGWVTEEATRFDLVVLAGDMMDAFANRSMADQANAVSKWLIRVDCPVVLCSGNHDYWVKSPHVKGDDPNAEAAWLKRLKGQGKIIGVDGDIISFRPKHSDEAPTKIVVNGWLQTSELDDDVDIVVTHAPPAGCYCSVGSEGYDVGDPDLWPSLQHHPPKLVLSGHVHRPYKFVCPWPQVEPRSLIMVSGVSNRNDIPSHWIIDTTLGRAAHNSGITVGFQWDS